VAWNVQGTALSRSGKDLIKVDLCDPKQIRDALLKYKPHVIIHCAAQRFPDKVDKNLDAATKLNVEASGEIARVCEEIGAWCLYISTDYVFADRGQKPGHLSKDQPNPLQNYGKLKLAGEQATLKAQPTGGVLRIPALYGPVEELSESPITNVVINTVLDTSKPAVHDAWATRMPTHVDDVAFIVRQLAERRMANAKFGGIFHFSGNEPYSKIEMARTMGKILGIDTKHLSGDSSQPTGSAAARPKDSRLDCSELVAMGFVLKITPFEEGLRSMLAPFNLSKTS
jgi:S-adenosylmethionine synthetase